MEIPRRHQATTTPAFLQEMPGGHSADWEGGQSSRPTARLEQEGWLVPMLRTAAEVAHRIASRWGYVLDRPPVSTEVLTAVEEEIRAAGFHLLALPEPQGGLGNEMGATSALLREIATVDACLAEWVLARMLASLPFCGSSSPLPREPLADGWSWGLALPPKEGTESGECRAVVRGWVPGCWVVYASAWRDGKRELALARSPADIEVERTLGLRGCACVSVSVQASSLQPLRNVEQDELDHWQECLWLWRSAIALANARAALHAACAYTMTRYQGGTCSAAIPPSKACSANRTRVC